MLRIDEVKILQACKPENLLSTDRIACMRAAQVERVSVEKMNLVRHKCGEYIFTLCKLLLDKLPSNLDAVSKLRFLTLRMVMSKTARPTFLQLPTELANSTIKLDDLESQWRDLGTLPLSEVLDSAATISDNVDVIDIVYFWGCALECKNAGGEQPFKDLAIFALNCILLPISNAVVERAFSVLNCIKCRKRNQLQLEKLEALMRLRIQLKVDNLCCKQFKPTKEMIQRFTSKMYLKLNDTDLAVASQESRPNGEDDEAPDNPEEQSAEELTAEDLETINMIDAAHFDENYEISI